MDRIRTWFAQQDKQNLTYWAGLFHLFVGVSVETSVSLALIVVGCILTGVSVVSSFFVTWLSSRGE